MERTPSKFDALYLHWANSPKELCRLVSRFFSYNHANTSRIKLCEGTFGCHLILSTVDDDHFVFACDSECLTGIDLYDLSDVSCRTICCIGSPITSMLVMGKKLVVAEKDQIISVWDINNCKKINWSFAYNSARLLCRLSENSFASAGSNVTIWNLDTWTTREGIKGTSYIRSIAGLSDHSVAIVDDKEDLSIAKYGLCSVQSIDTPGHVRRVFALNSDTLIYASSYRISKYSISRKRESSFLIGNKDIYPAGFVLLPDNLVAILDHSKRGSSEVLICDTKSMKLVEDFRVKNAESVIAVGEKLVFGLYSGSISIYERC